MFSNRHIAQGIDSYILASGQKQVLGDAIRARVSSHYYNENFPSFNWAVNGMLGLYNHDRM